MNEDYLWDKSGNDAEIAALEAKLSAVSLRTQPKFPIEPARKGFSFLRFAWAIPVFALVLIGIFFFQSGRTPSNESLVASEKPPVKTLESDFPKNDQIVTFESPTAKPQSVKFAVAKKMLPAKLKPTARLRTAKPKIYVKKTEKISPDEQYAYDQLMRALSITGENLAQVREKSGESTSTLR